MLGVRRKGILTGNILAVIIGMALSISPMSTAAGGPSTPKNITIFGVPLGEPISTLKECPKARGKEKLKGSGAYEIEHDLTYICYAVLYGDANEFYAEIHHPETERSSVIVSEPVVTVMNGVVHSIMTSLSAPPDFLFVVIGKLGPDYILIGPGQLMWDNSSIYAVYHSRSLTVQTAEYKRHVSRTAPKESAKRYKF